MNNRAVPSIHKQIRNLLIVLSSGVICAFVFAGILLHYYNPSGRYKIQNVLLSPEILSQLYFDDPNPKSGSDMRYIFDHIEYSYWIPEMKNWHKVDVSQDHYKQFFEEVAKDESIVEVPEDTVNLFSKGTPSKLTLFVKPAEKQATLDSVKTFQTIQIAPKSGYYRVELRESTSTEGWAYFNHQGIDNIVEKIFISELPFTQ